MPCYSRFLLPALTGIACSLAAGCAGNPVTPSFETGRYAAHVRVLASDEFEGRRPATIGEEKTISYLEQEFRKATASKWQDIYVILYDYAYELKGYKSVPDFMLQMMARFGLALPDQLGIYPD